MEEYDDANQADNTLVPSTSQSLVHENEEEKLKHLEFVRKAVESIVVVVADLYELTKENIGPLKTRVDSFEGSMKTTVGPVFDSFHHLLLHLLQLLDSKVDELIYEIDWQHHPLPELLRRIAMKSPEIIRDLALEIHRSGILDVAATATKEAYRKCKPVATELMYKYEPVAEEYAVQAWRWCNQIPILSQVTQTMVPIALLCAQRYNQAVDLTAERGFPVAGYLPSIPVERLAPTFSEATNDGFEHDSSGTLYEPDNVGGSDGALRLTY